MEINRDIYYYSLNGGEVDFLVREGEKITTLIQACYDLADYQTKERELKSLIKASQELKCNNLLIITSDFEKKERIKGKTIKFIPLWKWLLET